MRNKTAERILSETPQETKDRVRGITSREIQLLRLGFHLNEHQDCYILYKYDITCYTEFWKIADYKQNRWDVFIANLIYDLQTAKKQFYVDLRASEGYKLRAKEDKKQILDKLNKYRSWLAEETRSKMGRNPNYQREVELRSKVEILKELYDSKRSI
jgi:hypothetical protein